MSYILDAFKKAERERDMTQFVNFYTHHEQKASKIPIWLWINAILVLSMLILALLFWSKEPIPPPKIYIMSPTVYQSISSSHNDPQRPHIPFQKETSTKKLSLSFSR